MPFLDLRASADSAREALGDVATLARLTRDLPAYLRASRGVDPTHEQLRQRVATRQQRFLSVVEQAIYRHPGSPYLKLLRHAGCELGDLQRLVMREGIEAALRALTDQGVYVTFDELKGRRAAVRGSQRFTFRHRDFSNPLVRPHVAMSTSGTAGRPVRVRYPLSFVAEMAAETRAVLAAHGIDRPSLLFWYPAPLLHIIMWARVGGSPAAWRYPVHPLPLPARLVARYLALLGRLGGYRFALPQRCDLERTDEILGWLRDQLRTGQQPILWTVASAATRVAIAASNTGQDLGGATFVMVGEPTTPARRRYVEAAGARVIVQYSGVEASGMSFSCGTPTAVDDVHVMSDRFAVTQRRRLAMERGPEVDALLITSLSPNSGKLALNAELGDYGQVAERDCGCLLGTLGMRTHLSDIRSFEKLSTEGVTFVRSDIQQILEDVLPARFGGTALDYQLAEVEAPNGATRVLLRVSPSVGTIDEMALRAAFLEEIGRGGPTDEYHARMWRSAGSIEIRREPPLATSAGKVLPIQLLRSSRPRARRP